MLLALKIFEIFPKHNGYNVISESFSLNSYIFVTLAIFFCDLKKLIVKNNNQNLEVKKVDQNQIQYYILNKNIIWISIFR